MELREKFRRLGIRFACYCGGWVDPQHDRKRIGFGSGVLDDYWTDFRTRLRQAAAKIRRACPEVKVLVYYDTQRDTSETGHERFRARAKSTRMRRISCAEIARKCARSCHWTRLESTSRR